MRWILIAAGIFVAIHLFYNDTQEAWNTFGETNCTKEEGVVVILSHHSMRSVEREFIESREERLGCVNLEHIRIPIDQEVK